MDAPKSEHASVAAGGPHRRPRVWLFVGVAAAAALAAGLIAVRLAPGPILVGLATSWLRAHGTESAIEITALSDHDLSARVRLGDARDPDLTIDRLYVSFTLDGPWRGHALEFTPRTVRLVRPRLRLRLKDGQPDFGRLKGIVAWAQALPPSSQPLPDLTVEAGQVRVTTGQGDLRLTIAGSVRSDRGVDLHGHLAPFTWKDPGVTVSAAGGRFALTRYGARLIASAQSDGAILQGARGQASAGTLRLFVDLPYPDRPDRWTGPLRMTLAADDLNARARDAALVKGGLDVSLTGSMDVSRARSMFTGALDAAAGTQSVVASGSTIRDLRVSLGVTGLDLVQDRNGVHIQASGRGRVAAAGLSYNGVAVSALSTDVVLADGRLWLHDRVVEGRASLKGRSAAQGGLPAPMIAKLTHGLPVLSGDQPYRKELAAALKAFRVEASDWRLDATPGGFRLAVPAPARLESTTGAVLTLGGRGSVVTAPSLRGDGSVTLSLAGGGLPLLTMQADDIAARPGAVTAALAGRAAADIRAARGADLSVRGRMALGSGGARFDLTDCAVFGARHLQAGDNAAEGVALRLCPGAGPLVLTRGAAWRALGRLEGMRGDSSGLAIGLRDAALSFDAGGRTGALDQARITVDQADVVDRTNPVRFRPLKLSGAMRLAQETWRGEFTAATVGGRELARVALVQASGDGGGCIDINTGALTFAPGGLQPADITPLAGAARNASGTAVFTGWFAWTAGGDLRSGGELVGRSLRFNGPSGLVADLNTDLRFTSLGPLTTAPGQRLTIASVETVTPLTNLNVVFELAADGVRVGSAGGDFAGGRISLDPMAIPYIDAGGVASAITLNHVNIGSVLAASNLADKVRMDAVVDGRIPFTVGSKGVTVRHGAVAAIGGGRLSISRAALGGPVVAGGATAVAAAGGSSFAQDFAYQAMENLAFDTLDASVNSLAHDRLGILFHIKGRHDPPTPQRAVFRLADVLGGRALSKPVPLPSGTRIDLTLDTSLNFGDLVDALAAAWRDAIRPRSDGRPAGASLPSPASTTTGPEAGHP